jgi:uncharacterized Ntn-hydrolase superfamily protein
MSLFNWIALHSWGSRVLLPLATMWSVLVFAAPNGHATFSIVAVDTVTGAVGSAGASCISGAQIIEGVAESIGAINTQSWWNAQNQARADSLLRAGDTPDSIISFMIQNDVQNDGFDETDRQYGVVTLAGTGASASHTGMNNSYWAGHRTGPGYAVQGNILLDSTIVLSMEAAFLQTSGPLEERLMAALQAAKVVGADSRCWGSGKSAISAFIKVTHPGDGGLFYLYEVVNNTTGSTDPIDVLQNQFDIWREAQRADVNLSTVAAHPDALPNTGLDTATIAVTPLNSDGISPTQGAAVNVVNTGSGTLLPVIDQGDGTFTAQLVSGTSLEVDSVRAFVDAGGEVREVAAVASVIYFLCGDTNEDGVVTAADIIYLVNHVFKGGPAPLPVSQAGDVDRSGALTSADVIYTVNFVFKSGIALCSW